MPRGKFFQLSNFLCDYLELICMRENNENIERAKNRKNRKPREIS